MCLMITSKSYLYAVDYNVQFDHLTKISNFKQYNKIFLLQCLDDKDTILCSKAYIGPI